MTDLAVILVTWNIRDLALDALESLYADLGTSDLSHTVYAVDNASSDDTVEAIAQRFPQANLIASQENLGFGGANNLAMRRIGFGTDEPHDLPHAVYLLNSDTITKPGATRTLYDTLMSAADIGLVGAQLEYGDGSFQHGAFAFPGLKQLWMEFFPVPGRLIEGSFNGRYSRALYKQGQPFEVDFTLGATMMLRREVIEQTDMFDEDFFVYCEEIDWAWRIHKAGWRVLSVPGARVVHLSGQSTSQVHAQSQIYLWTSRLRLFEKHYPRWKQWIARKMIIAGMNRKIKQVENDAAIDPESRQELVAAYRQIRALARGN